MEFHELPDLSDWRFVEVLTIEEAAMLWGGIDPSEWATTSLDILRGTISPVQFRKAWTARKAFTEAVCAGTLPFVDAWERREDWQSGAYDFRVEFPDLPNPNCLIANMTRINQAALLKWAKGKLPSLRVDLMRRAAPVQIAAKSDEVSRPVRGHQEQRPLMLPSYTTPAIELLRAHVEENLAGVSDAERMTPGEQRAWLESQAAHHGLGKREVEAVYYVARPESVKAAATGKGVRPKTK
ncbi:hypothetical protein [Microvirgula aerodenitrificans]|uniref:hypothetical protein n=1 Tax=Microvirgula aerodenitrificans TaxID=57480 RepID=UPI00055E0746|nr:hypothetical protein [Microvirgula aerodenitrificans]